ncbi:MFS transporter [Rhizobium sp. AG207R]|uniref:MFS transporter n=1 Tax=Rhizobium sp. AG207R TaxID=2802287 RepID=UPI0022AC21EB|nr:MFS transporter [Rhizobium sp. AG207R]MCZ3378423.1 MFS transporter [Rhizobium sp. AG207R]
MSVDEISGSAAIHAKRANEMTAQRAALAAAAGSAIEYYEFGIYGYMAVFLSQIFFPSGDQTAALLSTFAVFGSAFLVRPAGGLILGMLGDRVGRRGVLIVTVVGMGMATAGIGILPTTATAGYIAPLLLVLLRLAQGFFAGGEVVGAAAFIAESAPTGRRGFYGSATPVGIALGGALAAMVCGLATHFVGQELMLVWGWRIPFLFAVPLVILSALLRHNVEETPAFKQFISKAKPKRASITRVVAEHPASIIKVILIAGAQNIGYWVGLIFMNVHLTANLGYDKTVVYWIMAVVSVLLAFMMPFWGGLSDQIGRKRVLVIGFAGYLVLVIPAMAFMAQNNLLLAAVAFFISTLPMPVIQAVGYPTYSEQFPTAVRYTAMAISINLAAIIGGGFTPYLSTWLISLTAFKLIPGLLLAAGAAIAMVTVLTLKETSHTDLP